MKRMGIIVLDSIFAPVQYLFTIFFTSNTAFIACREISVADVKRHRVHHFTMYDGRSKSFEPYPFKRKVDK